MKLGAAGIFTCHRWRSGSPAAWLRILALVYASISMVSGVLDAGFVLDRQQPNADAEGGQMQACPIRRPR